MIRRLAVLAIIALAFATQANAVGTQTVTVARIGSSLVRVTIAWTSDGSGNVSGNTITGFPAGKLEQVQFVPGTGGVAPDANYDVTLADQYGVDLLVANGQNLAAATSKQLLFSPASILDAQPVLTIAGAGAANSGTVIAWVRQ